MTDTVGAAPTTDTPAQAGPEALSGAGLLGLAVGSIGSYDAEHEVVDADDARHKPGFAI
jgi:hypothetical protein